MKHNYTPDCPEAFLWAEVEDGIKVTGYTGGMDYIAIPAQIDGKPVVEIGCGPSYEFRKPFFTVQLPATVKRLDLNAISSRDIPRFRGHYASGWIGSLEIHPDNPYLQIRDGILYGDGGSTVLATMDGAITALEIPAGVTAIAPEAFAYCDALKSVTFPEGLRSIGKKAFLDADFEEVTLPETLETLEYAGIVAKSPLNVPAALRHAAPGHMLHWNNSDAHPNFRVRDSYSQETTKYKKALDLISGGSNLAIVSSSRFYALS